MNRTLALMACLVALTACKDTPGQNTYGAGDVGISHAVQFGTVLNVRQVDITGENSGTGVLAGAGLGAAGGSYIGQNDGSTWAMVGTAVAGAIAGHYAEQAMNDRKGLEYTVQLQSGEVKTIVQEEHTDETPFKAGDKVMLQYCDAGDKSHKCGDGKQYQRLLPVQKLPPYVKKKRKSYDADVPPPEFHQDAKSADGWDY